MDISTRNNGRTVQELLRYAAEEATRAPSVLNTQPWRWHVGEDGLDLHADRTRQLHAIDPAGRLLILSCGAALHHARVALAASGINPSVRRYPDAADPDLLARVRSGGIQPVRAEDAAAADAMRQRKTDRRPFLASGPATGDTLDALHAAATAEDATLHRIDGDQIAYLRAAEHGAQIIEAKDERRREELREWTGRPAEEGDGVPPETVAGPTPRPVPLRGFGLGDRAALTPGTGDDRSAGYLLLATRTDEPAAWLRAGEAVSAVWLTAISLGLAVSPMSDAVEVPGARALLRSLLPHGGNPQLVLRVGADPGSPPPASPRRPTGDVIGDETGP
ncbi:nitroreductase [Dactylosporangium sp. NPDC050588]|uniref:Acg family FMN-binding oxidoreductase n=1 Tax=Dactylosporangium sp. NPDC050588 TaxID=3157211 RepID=UPI003408CC7D